MTSAGYFVTFVALAVALLAYIVMALHEPLTLSTIQPWLSPNTLMLGVSAPAVGAALAGLAAAPHMPKTKTSVQKSPASTPTPPPPAAASPQASTSPDLPAGPRVYTLPSLGSYVLLSVDEAQNVEVMMNDLRRKVAYLEEKLADADRLLGARTREARAREAPCLPGSPVSGRSVWRGFRGPAK